ncbi:unnamed protein product [Mytilus edulis]|uniref:Uncharacterized protein n=1 Tax=Mytilus edulis TaxID=6550 RepID=A0A8S3UF53_MYTED|nr:unnamed protein product [Mytilus edulis]
MGHESPINRNLHDSYKDRYLSLVDISDVSTWVGFVTGDISLPINEVHKHLSQTPAPVKVNVSLSGNNSKRGSYSSVGGLSNISQEKRQQNTTVVAYLRNQGGTHCYELYLLAREILLLCNQLHLQIVVRHVPGNWCWQIVCQDTYPSQYRVGTSPISISGNNTSVGVSSCRPVCNKPQLQSSSVHVSCTRSESLRSRLHECSLGRDVRLRFPTVQISVTSSSEDLSRARVDHSYCSSLTQTSLISRSSPSVLCSSTGSTSTTQSSVPVQGQDTSSQSREATSVRVASLRDSFKERGVSECAARHLSRAVRDSTNTVYYAK